MRLKSELPAALKYQAVVTESAARDAGLDFFDVVFELLEARDVNGVAAYGGFPVRYPSWRFGMEYERLEKGRHWGLSKIYELVINNDPTYAYLVNSNSLLEQKLVMAHVYAHADFFKHNLWFAPTDRKMLDSMGNHAVRIRRYVDLMGQERVERFLDLCLSLDTLIDPYMPVREHANPRGRTSVHTPASERARRAMDALSLTPDPVVEEKAPKPTASELPSYDVLGFLELHAPLEGWQQDVLHIVRSEAYYFSPQRMTKIMNEGWASFWHSRLLTGGLLDPSEILDFADCHSGATMAPAGQLNPYNLGIALFRYAEAHGFDIFQLRHVHNDVSLVHKLVDEDFAWRHIRPILAGRPVGDGKGDEPPTWQEMKSWLLHQLAWGGLPQIQLVGVDTAGEGELLLHHHHDWRDLQLGRAHETLLNLAQVWSGPVHLSTIVEGQAKRLVARDGEVKMSDDAERADDPDAGDADEDRRQAG